MLLWNGTDVTYRLPGRRTLPASWPQSGLDQPLSVDVITAVPVRRTRLQFNSFCFSDHRCSYLEHFTASCHVQSYFRNENENWNYCTSFCEYENENYDNLWNENDIKIKIKIGNKKACLAVADEPARRDSMPKIAPIQHAYNVIADNRVFSQWRYYLLAAIFDNKQRKPQQQGVECFKSRFRRKSSLAQENEYWWNRLIGLYTPMKVDNTVTTLSSIVYNTVVKAIDLA